DVAKLEVMRRLTARGVPAAEAAAIALAGAAQPDGGGTGRDGGGRTLPVGGAGPAARGLARAASRLDSPMMLGTIAAAISTDGVVPTWEGLLRPVLAGVGSRHAASGRYV